MCKQEKRTTEESGSFFAFFLFDISYYIKYLFEVRRQARAERGAPPRSLRRTTANAYFIQAERSARAQKPDEIG